MHDPDLASADDAEAVRLQAEEHPLIEDAPPVTPAEHCLRLMHLRAYDEAVRHAEGRDVLDVGCNTGYGTMRYVPVARRVVGVDVSPKAIEAARSRAASAEAEFLVTTGFALPFPDGSFDLITSFQVLEHVPDATAFLEELARVTRPGGTVILATPNAATRLDPGMTPWNRFHVREYRADELAALVRPVFGAVRVLGMFGRRGLYDTEIRRVDAARRRIRRRTDAAARSAAARESKQARAAAKAARRSSPWLWRIARALAPAPVRGWLRAVRPGSSIGRAPAIAAATSSSAVASAPPAEPNAPPLIPLEDFVRFTVDDLWYAPKDLDRSMDLLAVCEVRPQPLTGR